jgi:rRNA maturation RNase YbeY
LILRFFFDDTNKFRIRRKELSVIADKILRGNGLFAEKVNIILTSDKRLQVINKRFLGHKDYTDIITFGDIVRKTVSGEIYISIERIKINCKKYSKGNIDNELHRVIIHGILHLAGYDDQKTTEKKQMTKMEDYYLNELDLLIQPKK